MTESTRKALHIGEIVRVEIEKVAHGGHFIARYEGAVIFLRHGIPGEVVEARITGVEKSFYRADVVAVLEASPARVAAPCSYAGRCGGCDFQHIEIGYQRSLKSEVIAEQFARIAKMEIEIEVEEVSTPLHWRTRFSATKDRDGELGFSEVRSNSIVPISHCPILLPEIDFPTLPRELIETGTRVEVALSTNGERTVATRKIRSHREEERAEAKIIEGAGELHYQVSTTLGEIDYQVNNSSFWQSNIVAPETLVNAVLEFAQLKAGDHLLDLYGGVGLFTGAALPIIGAGGRVDLIEGSASATSDATINFDGYSNVKIHTGDVAKVMRKIQRADVVILDPPRVGAGRPVIEAITAVSPRAIIYVACDPAALARDTAYLYEMDFHLSEIRAFDLFPMTHHIESVALYTPRKVS